MRQRSAEDEMISGLRIPVPFTAEEWGNITWDEIPHNKRVMEYLAECVQDIQASDRITHYGDIFLAAAHSGRLLEFDVQSSSRFLEEAAAQVPTPAQLERALDLILNIAGPSRVLPNVATAFELTQVVGLLVDQIASAQFPDNKRLRACVDRVLQHSVALFVIAVNVELGLAKGDDWQLPQRL